MLTHDEDDDGDDQRFKRYVETLLTQRETPLELEKGRSPQVEATMPCPSPQLRW